MIFKVVSIICLFLLSSVSLNAKSKEYSIVINKNIIGIDSKKMTKKMTKSLIGFVGSAVESLHIEVKKHHKRFKVKNIRANNINKYTSDFYFYLDLENKEIKRCKKKCKIDYKIIFYNVLSKDKTLISVQGLLSVKSGYIKIENSEKTKAVEEIKKLLIEG